MNTQQAILEQEQRIEHYKGVLERYGRGRWYNLGRRTLEEMQEQLHRMKHPETSSDSTTYALDDSHEEPQAEPQNTAIVPSPSP